MLTIKFKASTSSGTGSSEDVFSNINTCSKKSDPGGSGGGSDDWDDSEVGDDAEEAAVGMP